MSKFKYQARDEKAQLVEGEIEAASAQAAAKDLSAKGYIPVKIERPFAFAFAGFDMGRVNIREQMVFFRQLAALVTAGVPLLESLFSVEKQISNKKLLSATKEVAKDIESGSALSQALSKHPKIFSDLMIAMVAAGEKAGVLDEVLARIAANLEKEAAFQQKLQSAMRYPISVLIALSAAFLVVVTFVIPKFGKVFASLGGKLPLPTRVLLGINFLIVHYWWLIIILGAAAYFSVKNYIRSPSGRRQYDQLLLKMPVFGEMITKVSLARFFAMLSAMLSSGVSLVYALEVTASVADNLIVSDAILKIREKVVGGGGLSGPMEEIDLFPPASIQMVAIGEKSGTLDKMLLKSSDYFSEEADYMISNMMTLLEPFLILFLGLLVLLLALGVFLPMWSMMQLYTR